MYALVSDGNLKGKSSVIEVVRWLLRGVASENLQEDVRRWIKFAVLQFSLDSEVFEVRVEDTQSESGTLSHITNGSDLILGQFSGSDAFTETMSEFFMRQLGLSEFVTWQSSVTEGTGKAAVHSWPALSGVLFMGNNYASLLGDLAPQSGLPVRLLQMYLGLPWISTLTAAQATLKGVQRLQEDERRREDFNQKERRNRLEVLQSALREKKQELSTFDNEADAESRYEDAVRNLWVRRSELQKLEQAVLESEANVTLAKQAHADDQRDLVAHDDATNAHAIFRVLDPSCCPRCESKITSDRKKREIELHQCAVCGEETESDSDEGELRKALEEASNASKQAVIEATNQLLALKAMRDAVESKVLELQAEISVIANDQVQRPLQSEIQRAIAALEARIDELAGGTTAHVGDSELVTILRATEDEARKRTTERQSELLKQVSERILSYARRFGMDALSSAKLLGNLNLSLVKGAETTSYSRVTEGEKLRLKVATILALIGVGESMGMGRHPGLLMIDSPGSQEVSPEDLEELMAGLAEISKEFSHLQIFVAGLASPAITDHVPDARRCQASGDNFLW
ncbi:MAG: large ATP-binding protein [Fimbriimonas sp.]